MWICCLMEQMGYYFDVLVSGCKYIFYVNLLFDLTRGFEKPVKIFKKEKRELLETDKNPPLKSGFLEAEKQETLLKILTFRDSSSKFILKVRSSRVENL